MENTEFEVGLNTISDHLPISILLKEKNRRKNCYYENIRKLNIALSAASSWDYFYKIESLQEGTSYVLYCSIVPFIRMNSPIENLHISLEIRGKDTAQNQTNDRLKVNNFRIDKILE